MLRKLNRFKANFLKVIKSFWFQRDRNKKCFSKDNNSFIGKHRLYTGETRHWFQVVLRLERLVIPTILPWVLVCGSYGFLIAFIDTYNLLIALPQTTGVITQAIVSFNIGLTLLLVFRTNTAHERFWEGRKLWGALVNAVRNLARGIWIVIKEKEPDDRVEKEAILRLVVAFAVAMKLHLRSDALDDQLASLISPRQFLHLKSTNHPPLQIAFWIGNYLQHQYECDRINVYQLSDLQKLVDELVDILGGCERILKTPLPLIYAIKFRQLVVIYCFLLPLEIVHDLGWWTGVITAFVSFTLLSIEQIGAEIEEPFGHDPNDLPLNVICNTIQRNVEELIKMAPVAIASADYRSHKAYR